MRILGNRVLVSQVEKEEKDGFQTVDVQDGFVYKGRVEMCNYPENVSSTTYQGEIKIGDIVIFAKYSPDTHEIEHEGKKYKSVLISDILAIL